MWAWAAFVATWVLSAVYLYEAGHRDTDSQGDDASDLWDPGAAVLSVWIGFLMAAAVYGILRLMHG